MTDASVPVTLAGKVYQLRYTYPDFKSMEKDAGAAYTQFIRPEILMSLTAQEIFLWRGLKKEENGRWVHAFLQTSEGQEEVGRLLWETLQQIGHPALIGNAIIEAFFTTGPFRKIGIGEEITDRGEEPKNSTT